jgi:hypothetical protein
MRSIDRGSDADFGGLRVRQPSWWGTRRPSNTGIPAEELEALNANIVGAIEVIREYRPSN